MNKIKVGAFGAFRGLVLMQSMAVMPEVEMVAVLDKNPGRRSRHPDGNPEQRGDPPRHRGRL